MAYEESGRAMIRCHEVHMENRERMSLTGIDDVKGFDENTVVLATSQGELTVRGEGLHIDKIDLEAGQLAMRGHIQELSYAETVSGGFFSRLFGG